MNSILKLDGALPSAIHDTGTWEKAFEALPMVQRLTEDDFGLIRKIVTAHDDIDSYLMSPNYYLFSGRNGLWSYAHHGMTILLCWHPNIPGKIIAFPPRGSYTPSLINEFLHTVTMPPNGMMIGRIMQGEHTKCLEHGIQNAGTAFVIRNEDILDWKYPVHILSTEETMRLSGQKYMYVRNRLHQINKHNIEIIPFDAVLHSRSMENLLHRWVSARASDRMEYENLYTPYETLFSMSMNPDAELSGLMIFVGGRVEAIGLWDIVGIKTKVANLYVNLCDTAIKGLSEFLMVKCCEILHLQNVERMNIGGSETDGLDRFKRKFRPVVSLAMDSIDLAKARYSHAYIERRTAVKGTYV